MSAFSLPPKSWILWIPFQVLIYCVTDHHRRLEACDSHTLLNMIPRKKSVKSIHLHLNIVHNSKNKIFLITVVFIDIFHWYNRTFKPLMALIIRKASPFYVITSLSCPIYTYTIMPEATHENTFVIVSTMEEKEKNKIIKENSSRVKYMSINYIPNCISKWLRLCDKYKCILILIKFETFDI